MRWRGVRRNQAEVAPAPVVPALTPSADALLAGLAGDWLLIDGSDRVIRESRRAAELGLVLFGGVAMPELAHMVTATRDDSRSRTLDVSIGGVAVGAPPRRIRAQATLVGEGRVLLLIHDISAASRVDAMRRDFIASVADEMRTPSEAILGLARQVREADNPKALRKSATRIEREANRLSSLVADLTDLSRLQAADAMDAARVVDVRAAIAQAVDAVARVAQDRRIDIVVDGPALHLYANEEQLVTALRNLLTNAITYSPPHTRVTVTVGSDEAHVLIAVADQGIGIRQEDQARIFERFHRIDEERSRESGGTGLGLAIVQHICMAHGGEVTVSSEPGRGSVFTLRFPAGRRVTEASARKWQEVP